jgi:hypothetical protein
MSADREYSAKTSAQYKSCITSLCRIYTDSLKKEFSFPHSVQDPDQIMSLLIPKYKKGTVRNYISAILWKLRTEHPDNFLELQQSYTKHGLLLKEETQREMSGREFELTEKEMKSFMYWEDILEVYSKVSQSLVRTNYDSFLEFVILSLYILHPPVRADYANMRIFIDDSLLPKRITDNYCVLQTNPRFVFQQYKNAKCHGTTIIPIDPELHNILLDWMDVNESDYLLSSYVPSKRAFLPLSENALTKRIISIFNQRAKKPVSINTLRHSFISFVTKNDQDYYAKQDNASKMMHSTYMAEKYRRMVYLK